MLSMHVFSQYSREECCKIFNLSGFLILYDIGLFRRAKDVRLNSNVELAIIYRG